MISLIYKMFMEHSCQALSLEPFNTPVNQFA